MRGLLIRYIQINKTLFHIVVNHCELDCELEKILDKVNNVHV